MPGMRAASKLIVVGLAFIMWCWPLWGYAQSSQYPAYVGHVNDFAGVVDAATEDQLEAVLLNFEEHTATQIAVVTIKTLDGRPIEEYANELYRVWGIGAKSGEHKNKGALLLIATQNRRSRLEVGYGLEGDLPDGLAGEMLRRMRPFFQQQEWSEGVMIGVRTLIDTLAQKWNISLEGIDRRYAYNHSSEGDEEDFPRRIFFFIFLLILLVMLSRMRNHKGRNGFNKVGWLGPLIFNRGGGSWGGFGSGSSSGSSWGGFGGGSSGGGGASDSW